MDEIHIQNTAVSDRSRSKVKKIEVKGFEVKNLRGTDSCLFLESIIVSPKKPPIARIELEIKYTEKINREMRLINVGDNLFNTSNEMGQYSGYVVQTIDLVSGTVTFTNGEVISTNEIIGDISERICAEFRYAKLSFPISRKRRRCITWA